MFRCNYCGKNIVELKYIELIEPVKLLEIPILLHNICYQELCENAGMDK